MKLLGDGSASGVDAAEVFLNTVQFPVLQSYVPFVAELLLIFCDSSALCLWCLMAVSYPNHVRHSFDLPPMFRLTHGLKPTTFTFTQHKPMTFTFTQHIPMTFSTDVHCFIYYVFTACLELRQFFKTCSHHVTSSCAEVSWKSKLCSVKLQ